VAVVEGASAGMHLSLRFIDPSLDDRAVTARLMEEGIVVNALSVHAVGERAPCQGLMLGYAQVPAELMDGLAQRVVAALA
jgi:GntR family transcriptional regulator/MocR family aminotransferase